MHWIDALCVELGSSGDWVVDPASHRSLDNSDVCVLRTPRGDTAFAKCADVAALMTRFEKTGEKWRISLRSFKNELALYRLLPCAHLAAVQVRIPRCLAMRDEVQSGAGEEEEESMHRRLMLALEYLDPAQHYQLHAFDAAHASAALKYMARFHAACWRRGDGRHQLPADVRAALFACLFTPGCWWRKHLRPSVKFHRLPHVFAQLCDTFPDAFAALARDTRAAAAMHAIAGNVDRIDAACGGAEARTIVHGDWKTSNLFFARSGDGSRPSAADVCAIDFQWTGAAHSGMGDVAYLILSGLQPELLSHAAETALLREYHSELAARMHGGDAGGSEYTWEECMRDYEWEVLDYVKTAGPQLLDGLTPSGMSENATKYGWLTHEYDARATAFLFARAVQAADAVGLVAAGP